MTKKHYIAIAAAIKTEVIEWQDKNGIDQIDAIRWTADAIGAALLADNPRFNYTRFIAACGFGELDQ